MNSPWTRFITSLEAKGVTFDQVKFATDRRCVIEAAGVTDALAIAVIETEWLTRVHGGPSTSSASTTSRVDALLSSPKKTLVRSGGAGTLRVLDDFTQLASLPEEVQDTVVAVEVMSAAVGFSGALLPLTQNGFTVSSLIPASMRGLCQSMLPVADAYLALRKVEAAEYMGRSLVAMALGEVVSEICTSYAHQIAQLQQWSGNRSLPLMAVVSEVLRIGHHVVRLRQVLPMDLLTRKADPSGMGTTTIGPRVLNHLYEQAERNAGSREEDELLLLLLRRAIVPYLHMLHRWMHEGVLEDPFGEFFISEVYEPSHPAPTASSRRRDVRYLFPEVTTTTTSNSASEVYGARLAQQDVAGFERRFSINEVLVPCFIASANKVASRVFVAGRYCCLLREYNDAIPSFGEAAESMVTWSGMEELHRSIQASFEVASGAVIELLFGSSVDLLGHLSSLKRYFLQERGDWVVDFLDSADDLLSKSADRIKAHSLRILLQASIARCCATDPYHDQIGCSISPYTLEEYIHQVAQRSRAGQTGEGEMGPTNEEDWSRGRRVGRQSTGTVDSQQCIELLQLDADLQWPLTLVLDAGVVKRFNAIFRLLMWVKTCERRLSSLRCDNEVLCSFPAAYGIAHQLVQFLRQFQFYAAHFVLEPLWSRLMRKMGQAESVFAISQALEGFFDRAERGLVLSSAIRFRSLTTILNLTTRFCEIGRHGSSATTMPLIEATLHAVQDSLLEALSELASPVGEDYPQLVPLLTWIDASGFYARNNIFRVQQQGIPGGNSGGGLGTVPV